MGGRIQWQFGEGEESICKQTLLQNWGWGGGPLPIYPGHVLHRSLHLELWGKKESVHNYVHIVQAANLKALSVAIWVTVEPLNMDMFIGPVIKCPN